MSRDTHRLPSKEVSDSCQRPLLERSRRDLGVGARSPSPLKRRHRGGGRAAGHKYRNDPALGERCSRAGHESTPVRLPLHRHDRLREPPTWGGDARSKGRRSGLDDEPHRGRGPSRSKGSGRTSFGGGEGERRERQGEKPRAQPRGREEKEKEEEREVIREEEQVVRRGQVIEGEGQEAALHQASGQEDPEVSVWGNGNGPRPEGQKEGGCTGCKATKEEEEELFGFVIEREQLRGERRGKRRTLRGDPEGEKGGEGGPGCPDKEMATNLLSSTGGIWDQTEGPLQPICCQYFRQVLSSRVSGGQAREALTLSWCLDLLIQARAAEAADGLMQRLKSLEMASQGAAWSVAQRVELIPAEKPIISSRAEAREAIKENKEESRTRADASKGKHKGEAWGTSWRDSSWHVDKGKGKEVKGKGKKGKEKDQGKKQE